MDGSFVFARWRQCAPQSNTCFLGPSRVHIPNSISIGSAVFAGLTIVTDRQLDRLTTLLRLQLLTACTYVVLRCGLIIITRRCSVERIVRIPLPRRTEIVTVAYR